MNIIITLIVFFAIFLIAVAMIIMDYQADAYFCLFASIVFLSAIFLLTQFHYDSAAKNINVSQELIDTIVETTGESYHDVYYFLKYAGAADMDLIEAVMTIDPDLTEEEAAAIIQISDYKQR